MMDGYNPPVALFLSSLSLNSGPHSRKEVTLDLKEFLPVHMLIIFLLCIFCSFVMILFLLRRFGFGI